MFRVGIGYDAHKLVKGRSLFLGGVKIPYSKGLEGHSDADVLLHAIVDALLGAAGLPDIGAYFSNKDPRWKNASSHIFLKKVQEIFKKKKIKIMNIDAVLLSEEPKISPYITKMKKEISLSLKCFPSQIGIKASTNERMGFVGKKQGMAATAVALVQVS
ncbi:MAG: 2-C-methyl-D-erythritol 2,4-cyclodiphosphate synthase [Elusimicrobia bacterium RIFCSPLOWO2_02_FULL_39_32]|nr:MAG: 2-C-methyl-D-erythritol 2,4-cyclodiphosphate synthase [Elusimicrobia bacterium GWA2_38_7]OGR80026.1 MAG: 2-C-methyl-D-erythritol 2,4-cyclodiphosphate synthase [Elusimicrobia bacterium RIFCSPHIGHO2_02_FULL_39_36]OGR91179.1 MAG: 2-C-methyl-D-erythritol 2,4-cyclodiphosphate synthase [Elusimicrobia bacterium RIFCSPLOWO2_02_FULL_39_32]OGS00147.1 MAG: 2-C-methyl-D-erythritol 2,4-cyclodiphosphate synthase [Elusimicrobia bacterium RIFCSPLOWO2_12_FULL_39_28]